MPTPIVAEASAFVLAFHKAGSQWVRDVLWTPELLRHLGLTQGVSGAEGRWWPRAGQGQLHAPVYSASFADWAFNRRQGDRAVVVLRDPRDMAASWIPSIVYSHRPGPFTASRGVLRQLDGSAQLIAAMVFLDRRAQQLQSWAGRESTGSEYVTSYERLIADQDTEFRRIVEFLGADPTARCVTDAIDQHRFEARSGRSPGQEDSHSHFRNGLAGDWRRWFDRVTGELFEAFFPGLVVQLGYETSADWYTYLPEQTAGTPLQPSATDPDTLLAELRRVQEENLLLRRVCDERLALIEQLSDQLSSTLSQLPATGPSDSSTAPTTDAPTDADASRGSDTGEPGEPGGADASTGSDNGEPGEPGEADGPGDSEYASADDGDRRSNSETS